MKATILKALFIAPFVVGAGCLWVPEGTWELGRLPQAAPSLVVLRTEPVPRLGHAATINYRKGETR